MRIVAISDTHLTHNGHRGPFPEIPEGDLLVHAGDLTFRGNALELREAFAWLEGLSHPNKIWIAGNHDWDLETNLEGTRPFFPRGCVYLQDSETTVEGFRIYGSPWQPRFFDWAFNKDRGADIRERWDRIPQGIDILVTHGPPFGFGDAVPERRGGEVLHQGCQDLLAAIRRVRPRLHICGHIHEGYGLRRSEDVVFVNASVCDEAYRPVNRPIVIDLPLG